MNPKLRPLPYDDPEDREQAICYLMEQVGVSRREASKYLTQVRHDVMREPLPGEKCGAHARTTGEPCKAPAGPNGRCKLHGGKSTGPRTEQGLARTLAAMKAAR